MKNLTFLLLSLIISFSSLAQEKPKFKFETETINYGAIKKGSDRVRFFEFTNIGESPLIISKITASCGCTIPKKPENEILPGEKGQIEVSYDTNRLGEFTKSITIYSNAESSRKVLRIKGVVLVE